MKKTFIATMMFGLLVKPIFSQISISKSPTFAWEKDYSSGSESWANMPFIYSDDLLYANSSATIIALGADTTEYLMANDFNFSIPAGATINGIEVTMDRAAANLLALFRVRDETISLSLSNVLIGDNKANTTNWGLVFQTGVYGGSVDLWGTTLTATDINDPTFGVAVSVQFEGLLGAAGSATLDALVDNIVIEVSYTPAPLPISLEYFNIKPSSGKVEFEWATLSELNNDFFSIEESYNGLDWIVLDTIKGAGNSNKRRKYKYVLLEGADSEHIHEQNLNHYYRLKQTDFDGKFECFDPIFIKANEVSHKDINLNHSSFSNRVVVNCKQGIREIYVYFSSGLLEKKISVSDSNEKFEFQLNSKGVKIIRVSDNLGKTRIFKTASL